MLNLTNLEAAPETKVEPSNNLFVELGRNTYEYPDLLAELIDNCIAARLDDIPLEVVIDVYIDSNGEPVKFVITDNAKGIAADRLGTAISPAGIQSVSSLNEHGLGMKQAVAAMGTLEYLATKTKGEEKARLVKEFRFGDILTYLVDFPQESGTQIVLSNLNPVVKASPQAITTTVMPYLGARYRRFLRSDDRVLHLKMNLRQIDNPEGIKSNWLIQDFKPIYFHPSTRKNEPVILKHPVTGNGWRAELTFGYAPSHDEEYIELGLQIPNQFHPYNVSLSKQGVDVIFQDRVILFHQLAELGIVNKHPMYNNIRGEIDLKQGFSTAITKNSMVSDRAFIECITKVGQIIRGEIQGPRDEVKDYLKNKRYPDDLPEKLLRDRLAEWLLTNPMHPRTDVKTEYCVDGIEGRIDIIADSELWEIKVNQANALDVYQLFMYMDVGGFDKGYLVADSFSTGAQVAKDFILKQHSKEIVLAPRGQLSINHPPDANERDKYYGKSQK